jgi:uncharacterized protein YbjT (DUF2867 family)
VISRSILVTGATGYLGRALIASARRRGHHLKALVRAETAHPLPPDVPQVTGSPFAIADLERALSPGDTLVHLIGTPRPNPRKAKQFREVDLASAEIAARAAARVGAAHLVYVSVAHPAPVMHAYIEARTQAEAAFRATGIPLTILRPWYVLGPGHWWPMVLLPLYKVLEAVPSKRAVALRLGLVTHAQMINALLCAIEEGPQGIRVIEVPEIRGMKTDSSNPVKPPVQDPP